MADEKEFENLTKGIAGIPSRKDPYQKICTLLGIAFVAKSSIATMRNAIIASNVANPTRDFAEILKKMSVYAPVAQPVAQPITRSMAQSIAPTVTSLDAPTIAPIDAPTIAPVEPVAPVATRDVSVVTQDTGKFRTNTMDQFYTSINVAKFCIEQIVSSLPADASAGDYLWIEPSAGNGAFFLNAPSGISPLGIDIDPKAPGIVKHDFLTWTPPVGDKKILVFGNPPFGRQSTFAKAFIARSCKFANIIAFILPKSFVKSSMSNAFSSLFHCAQSIELAKNAFILNDSPYDVPCVFQIWQKKDIARAVVSKVAACGFQYMKAEDDMKYDIALRRVGGLAGKCYAPSDGPFSVQSHYFLKFDSTNQLDELMKKINGHSFPSNTVGPRSLSKSEINVVLNGFISAIGVAAAPSVAPSPVEI